MEHPLEPFRFRQIRRAADGRHYHSDRLPRPIRGDGPSSRFESMQPYFQ